VKSSCASPSNSAPDSFPEPVRGASGRTCCAVSGVLEVRYGSSVRPGEARTGRVALPPARVLYCVSSFRARSPATYRVEAAGIEPAQGSSRERPTHRRPPDDCSYTKRGPGRATRHDCIVRWFLAVVAMAAIVVASPLAAPDPWGPLRRPLTVPRIAPGTPCPVSQVDTSVDFAAMGVGQGLGRGPAYPVGLADGTMTLAPADNFNSREWMGQKVLWFVPARYRGPVLIDNSTGRTASDSSAAMFLRSNSGLRPRRASRGRGSRGMRAAILHSHGCEPPVATATR